MASKAEVRSVLLAIARIARLPEKIHRENRPCATLFLADNSEISEIHPRILVEASA